MAEKCEPEGILRYKLDRAPSTAYYIPNFLSEEETDHLWHKVNSAPLPKWTQLTHRRLQNWGGIPHAKGMVREELPDWLQKSCTRVAELGVFGGVRPNHVLVNEYTPGQGIMPHTDGPLYHPVVTTISLGSTALLDFYLPIQESEDSPSTLEDRYVTSILLEPGSLLILTDDMYKLYVHGIAARTEDILTESVCNLSQCGRRDLIEGATEARGTRVSLTIRNVPKVAKFDLLHHVLGKRPNQ